jgi:hypothetical protein
MTYSRTNDSTERVALETHVIIIIIIMHASLSSEHQLVDFPRRQKKEHFSFCVCGVVRRHFCVRQTEKEVLLLFLAYHR